MPATPSMTVGLDEPPAAASAFLACCLVFARRFWNQTWGKDGMNNAVIADK